MVQISGEASTHVDGTSGIPPHSVSREEFTGILNTFVADEGLPEFTAEESDAIFNKLDTNEDNVLDQQEITPELLKNAIFMMVSDLDRDFDVLENMYHMQSLSQLFDGSDVDKKDGVTDTDVDTDVDTDDETEVS